MDICSLPLEDKKTGKRLVAQLWDTQGEYLLVLISSRLLHYRPRAIQFINNSKRGCVYV